MRSILKKVLAVIVIAGMTACADDDTTSTPQVDPISIQFDQNLSLTESSGSTNITVKFSKPAPADSKFFIEVVNEDGAEFSTNPALVDDKIEVTVSKSDTEASIQITIQDDEEENDDRIIGLTLLDLGDGLTLGSKQNMMLTITDDDEPASPSTIEFDNHDGSVIESNSLVVTMKLSEPSPKASVVTLLFSQEESSQEFITVPAMNVDNTLNLQVPAGAEEVSFTLSVTDDELFNLHDQLTIEIQSVGEGLVQGELDTTVIEVKDNELMGRPKSYLNQGGIWSFENTYKYDLQGRISKIHWVKNTPTTTTGTTTYYYADNGLIERINTHADEDEHFYQVNGKIVKSEVIENGVVLSYKMYDYDTQGNVSGFAEYHRLDDGSYISTNIVLYLYYQDNNLYKQMIYTPGEGEAEPTLMVERTYYSYGNEENEWATLEVIPGFRTQRNLPASVVMKENDVEIVYQMSYSFDDQGKLTGRASASQYGLETVSYTYY